MNTDTRSNESTSSYRVDAFEPVREVRERLGGDGGMTDEEVQAMKREAVERYGGYPKSADEVKAESHFFHGEADDGLPADLDMKSEYCRNQALAAVFDQSIREDPDDEPGFVSIEACLDRLQHYPPGGEAITDTGKAWRSVFQKIPDDYLGDRTTDAGEREMRTARKNYLSQQICNSIERENRTCRSQIFLMTTTSLPAKKR